jgi:hypothetical protein
MATKLILLEQHNNNHLRCTRYIGKQHHEVALLDIQDSDTSAIIAAFVEEMRVDGLPNEPVQA